MVKLKQAIKIVEKWVDEAKMKINKKKSGIIFLRKNRRKEGDEDRPKKDEESNF